MERPGIEIDQAVGEVELKDFIQVKPFETTTYMLKAINGSINRSMTLKIMVQL